MAFTLLLTLLIGGFILMYPLTKRLGALLESKMRAERNAALPDESELRQLTETVRALEAELQQLRERQEFTEKLVRGRTPEPLPRPSQDRPQQGG